MASDTTTGPEQGPHSAAPRSRLIYEREDGVQIVYDGECWMLELAPDGSVRFKRFHDGRLLESYFPQPRARAAISAAAIIHGFEPPRALVRLDKPFDQIPSADAPARAV